MAALEQLRTQTDSAGDSAIGRTATICRADDLKGFLLQLSDQIADADRRHSAALRDMHERLSRLGGQTGSLKATLPKEFSADLERLEAGMASLVQRIVESDQARPAPPAEHDDAATAAHAAADAPKYADEATVAAVAVPAADIAASQHDHDHDHEHDHQPAASPNWTDPSRAALLSAAPPALKSAMSASAPAWTSVTHMAAPVALAAVSPVAAPVPVSPSEEPWDNQSAEALVQLYASGEPGLPPPPAPVETVHIAPAIPLAAVPVAASAAAALAAPVLADLPAARVPAEPAPEAIDRAWFEDRLNAMASRVEQSLSDLRPDDAIANLGRRFDQIEERWSTALSDVATRSDVEGLRLVEAHIAELTQRFDEAQGQLARLDLIEKQLAELGHQLTDENVVRLFGNLIPTEADLSHFAEMAADKVATRFIEQMPVTAPQPASVVAAEPVASEAFEMAQQASAERIGALQQMLAGFIDERRRGEVETAEALETMQHAMQHVLDRVDHFDAGRQAPQHAHAAPTHGMSMSMTPAAPAFAPDTFDDVRNSVKAAAAAASASRIAPGSPVRMGLDSGPPRRIEPMLEQEPDAPTELADPRGGAADRRSVVDTARRAAEKAAEKAKVTAADAAPKARSGGVRDRLLGGAGKGEKVGVKPALLLVPSVALIMLVGVWWFASGPKRAAPATVVIEDVTTPASAKPASKPNMAPAIAPAGNLELPAPAAKPEVTPPAKPEQRGEAPGTRNRDQADAGQSIITGTIQGEGPRVVAGPFAGIAVQQSGNAVTAEEAMRAREKSRLASLSQRTAQNAAMTSSVTPAAVPASLQQDGDEPAPAATPLPDGKTMLELPPALVGPLSLRLAAAKGDPSAQFEVAARFAEGKGVKQDFAQAAIWYQRSAAQGLANAQYRLAALYERGLGVKADPMRARLWYKRAAEQGSVKAMHNLAVLSASRDQGSTDYPSAVQWFSEAAERGLSDSQYNLGVLYESGLGVSKDLAAAYKWYAIAARSGDVEAVRRQQLLRGKLDAATLQKAEDSVEIWRPRAIEGLANDATAAGTAWKARANGNAAAQAN